MCVEGFEWYCGAGVEATTSQSYVSFEGVLLLVAVAYCWKGHFFDAILFGNDHDMEYWDDVNTLDVRRVKHVKQQIVTKRVVTCQHNDSYDKDNNNDNNKRVCAICLEEFKLNDLVSWSKQNTKNTVCNHVFHHRCILPWIVQHSSTCPCCRCEYVTYPNRTNKLSSYFVLSSMTRNEKRMQEEEDTSNEREQLRFCVRHGLTHCCCDCCHDGNDNQKMIIDDNDDDAIVCE